MIDCSLPWPTRWLLQTITVMSLRTIIKAFGYIVRYTVSMNSDWLEARTQWLTVISGIGNTARSPAKFSQHLSERASRCHGALSCYVASMLLAAAAWGGRHCRLFKLQPSLSLCWYEIQYLIFWDLSRNHPCSRPQYAHKHAWITIGIHII